MSNKAFNYRRPTTGTIQMIQEGRDEYNSDAEELEQQEPPKADDSWQDDHYADLGEEWTSEAEKQSTPKVTVDVDSNVVLDKANTVHQMEPALA